MTRRRPVNLRFDPDLWDRVKEAAAQEGRTATNFLETAARSALEGVTIEFECTCGAKHVITRRGWQTIAAQATGKTEEV